MGIEKIIGGGRMGPAEIDPYERIINIVINQNLELQQIKAKLDDLINRRDSLDKISRFTMFKKRSGLRSPRQLAKINREIEVLSSEYSFRTGKISNSIRDQAKILIESKAAMGL